MASTKMIVRGHGIQPSLEAPIPVPFDIKRDLLSGSQIDKPAISFLIRAYITKMAPPSANDTLVDWLNMSSSEMLTVALAYVEVNASKNRQGTVLTKFKPITDQDVNARVQQMVETTGFISPNEWDKRFFNPRFKR